MGLGFPIQTSVEQYKVQKIIHIHMRLLTIEHFCNKIVDLINNCQNVIKLNMANRKPK